MATLTAREHQVDAHLYQIFTRLGITSRAALRDALTTLAS